MIFYCAAASKTHMLYASADFKVTLTLKGPFVNILLRLLCDISKAKISVQISQIETRILKN